MRFLFLLLFSLTSFTSLVGAQSVPNTGYARNCVLNSSVQDQDEDCVIDQDDLCPGTQVDSDGFYFVDKNGCSCEQKTCLSGFTCMNVFVTEFNAQNQRETMFRARCVEEAQDNAYDLRMALRDAQNIDRNDDRFLTVYPEHLVGADEKSLRGDASDITLFFQRFANGITILAGSVAVLFLIINGFTLVVSTGSSDQVETAKKGLMWSAISLVLIIFSYVIVKTVLNLVYSGQSFEDETRNKPNPLESIEKQFDDMNESISDLNNNINNRERDIDRQEQQLEILEKTRTDLTNSNRLSDEGKDQLDEEIEDLEEAIKDAKEKVENLKKERSDAEKARDIYQQMIIDEKNK